jgi:hypothetical protein
MSFAHSLNWQVFWLCIFLKYGTNTLQISHFPEACKGDMKFLVPRCTQAIDISGPFKKLLENHTSFADKLSNWTEVRKEVYDDVNSFNPNVAILEFWQRRLLKLTKYFGKYLKKHCSH